MKLFTPKIIYIVGLISLAIAKDEIKNSNNKDSRVLLKVENHEGIKAEKNIEREVQKVTPADDDDQAPPPPTDDGNNDDDQAPPPTDDGNDDDVISPTPTNCGTVIVKIVTDDYPAETSFEIVNLSGNVVMSGSGYTGKRQEYVKTGCLPYATYDLIMRDSYNDGMCCTYGDGSYELSVNGAVIKTGGQYGASETTRFSTSSGSSPTTAPGPCLNVIVTITTDDYPGETTFKVVNQNGAEFMSGGPYSGKRTEYAKASCLSSSNTYTFTIFDSYSDGICCSYGNGSYRLAVDGAVVKSGATFGASESTTFGSSSPPPPTPTIDVLVKITTDSYPAETSFKVTSQSGAVFMEGGSYTGQLTSYTESKSLSTSNQYTFTIFDSYNDGMCCNYGNGSYEVSVNGAVIKTGGQFGASESTPLSGQAPPPTDDGNNDDDQAPPPTDDGNNDDDQAQSYNKPQYTKPTYNKPKYDKPGNSTDDGN